MPYPSGLLDSLPEIGMIGLRANKVLEVFFLGEMLQQ